MLSRWVYGGYTGFGSSNWRSFLEFLWKLMNVDRGRWDIFNSPSPSSGKRWRHKRDKLIALIFSRSVSSAAGNGSGPWKGQGSDPINNFSLLRCDLQIDRFTSGLLCKEKINSAHRLINFTCNLPKSFGLALLNQRLGQFRDLCSYYYRSRSIVLLKQSQ